MGNVLGRVRLSRSTDESTSVERQHEVIQQWANANDHQIVGWAVDEDVSGSVDPFETPALGPWLTDPEKYAAFDIIAAWKLDRLGRNARQLNKLFGWCQDNDKTLLTTAEQLDLGTWSGQLLATVMAGLAEGELEAIRERQLASRQKLRGMGRWSGGKVPFGYRSIRLDGGGWKLEPDPVSREVVRKIVDEIIEGKPITALAREMNQAGYLIPSKYYRLVKSGAEPTVFGDNGKSRNGTASGWSPTVLRNMLRSKALLGHAHHNGQTVRDDEGLPVLIAEPLVTLDEWELIQASLDRSLSARNVRRAETSPMLGVLTCFTCGSRLHHSQSTAKGKLYRYYRCTENGDAGNVPAQYAEQIVEEEFLEAVGALEVQERVWVPGASNEAELREAVTAIDELSKLVGTMNSATSKERLTRQISALDTRIADLEAEPSEAARWEYRPTGRTYADVWETADEQGRRALLLKSGITLAIRYKGYAEASLYVPGEIRENLG